jgi:hypothetical protein
MLALLVAWEMKKPWLEAPPKRQCWKLALWTEITCPHGRDYFPQADFRGTSQNIISGGLEDLIVISMEFL